MILCKHHMKVTKMLKVASSMVSNKIETDRLLPYYSSLKLLTTEEFNAEMHKRNAYHFYTFSLRLNRHDPLLIFLCINSPNSFRT